MGDSPTPNEVRLWLEWAGERLMALQVSGVRPQEYRSFWPDYPDEQTAYGYTNPEFRIPTPSSQDITLMDEIFDLVKNCSLQSTRRVLQKRALVHPISGRYKVSWTELAVYYHVDRKTVKRWHQAGLIEILEGVPLLKLGRISLSLSNNTLTKLQESSIGKASF